MDGSQSTIRSPRSPARPSPVPSSRRGPAPAAAAPPGSRSLTSAWTALSPASGADDVREVDRSSEDHLGPATECQGLEDLVGRRRPDNIGRDDRYAGTDRDVSPPGFISPSRRPEAGTIGPPGRSAGRGPFSSALRAARIAARSRPLRLTGMQPMYEQIPCSQGDS